MHLHLQISMSPTQVSKIPFDPASEVNLCKVSQIPVDPTSEGSCLMLLPVMGWKHCCTVLN